MRSLSLSLNICVLVWLLSNHRIVCDVESDDHNGNDKEDITRAVQWCPFSGARYQLGDTWQRRLDTPSAVYCVACNCAQGGKSNCTSKSCVSLIQVCQGSTKLSSTDRGCCQQCLDTKETQRVNILVQSGTETRVTTGRPFPQKSTCLHNGKTYYENQVFASNTSGIHRTHANQCVQCICQSGLVLCRLKTCLANSCTSFADSDGFNQDCCPLRESCRDKPISDANDSSREGHLVTIYSPNDQSGGTDDRFSANDCQSSGRVYANGDQWHPIIGPLGQMECVVCICNKGSIDCSRVTCHPLPKHCLKPIKIQGQCCLSCAQPTQQEKIEDQSTTSEPSVESSTEGHNTSDHSVCIPLRMDSIAYRSHGQTGSSGYYQYAFQTQATNRSTTLYSFTVKEGKISDFSEQHLTEREFKVLSQTFSFKLLGATKAKFIEKFAKRTKKFPQRCSQMCETRVERLERTLRAKPVVNTGVCDSNSFHFY